MNKEAIKEKVKEMISAQSCYPDLKKVGEDWLSSIGNTDEKEKFDILLESVKNCKSSIDACIAFLQSDIGKQIYGDSVGTVLKNAEDRKAQGEDTCICPACQACKAIINEANNA